jgi:hypothetical protein
VFTAAVVRRQIKIARTSCRNAPIAGLLPPSWGSERALTGLCKGYAKDMPTEHRHHPRCCSSHCGGTHRKFTQFAAIANNLTLAQCPYLIGSLQPQSMRSLPNDSSNGE